MKHAPLLAGVLSMLLAGCAASPVGDAASPELHPEDVLPLRRVRLYASGVGYFERRGTVEGGRTVLPVPTGHLDDALKSFVLLEPGGVSSVSFPSRLSPAVARSRAGLPADSETALSYDRLLAALRGERVELLIEPGTDAEGGTRVRGRVVDVVAIGPDHPSYDHGPVTRAIPEGHVKIEEPERLYLLILSDDGEIRQLDTATLSSVRPLDEAIGTRLRAAMSARLASRSSKPQALALAPNGSAREVRIAYLAEAPTWRASYRLLVDASAASAEKNATLQGWALLHNDTDEAWKDVAIELIDGRPSSFLFPMAAPRYERRDLEVPERVLSSVPQLSTTTPDAMWGDYSDYEGEAVARLGATEAWGAGGLGLSGSGSGGGGYGLGRAGVSRSHSTVAGSDLLWLGNLAARAGVVPSTHHATSVFRVKQAIQLRPQHSAMVPFLDAALGARPIVWFGTLGSAPERAVGVQNTTAHTLPAGPLAVFGDGGFLGEALLEKLKPGARQFARIGDETDVELTATTSTPAVEARHVDYRAGRLRVHSIRSVKTTVWFQNRSGRPREVYVGLPIVDNATLEGTDRVDYESTSRTPLAVFHVVARPSGAREIVTREARVEGTPLADVTVADIAELVQETTLPADEVAILRRAQPLVEDRDGARRKRLELDTEIQAVEADLERLKKHAASFGGGDSKGGGEALAALVTRTLERDDRLRTLQTERRALEKDIAEREAAIEVALEAFEALRPQILEERERAKRG